MTHAFRISYLRIVEISGDVTDAGRTPDKQCIAGKIKLSAN